ncbi:MAG: hypothetical protein HY918_01755 [Candidatus Doudnabacteria bacterium]|nr:hypothetical protein [Candidatus Doudnabacteria bacterium]
MRTFYKIIGAAGLFFAFAASASAATLSLSPSTQTLNVGDTITVNVMLDTQGQSIDGVDLQAINYNPYNLQLQDADSSVSGTQIKAGTLMPSTVANSVDTTNGKIVFSQITNAGSTYSGSGILATLTFKALVAGNVPVTINYTSGATTDSNVASNGADILSSVTNGQYVINNVVSNTVQAPTAGGAGNQGNTNTNNNSSGGVLRLVNSSGTYYLIINGVRHGITNPGMLNTYGFTFTMGKTATAADLALPEGSLLTPNDGALVKSKEDPTVYLISNQQRYGFVSANVFTTLGFKFASVLVVTNPELQALPKATNLDNGSAQHLAGLDINKNGTVYWVGPDGQLHGYPSLAVYNSWHLPNDFSRVVPANDADMSLPQGGLVTQRNLEQ